MAGKTPPRRIDRPADEGTQTEISGAASGPAGAGVETEAVAALRAERYRAADKLKGQAALITGGDSGIGRSVTYLYAREGADVAITCMESEVSDAEVVRKAVEDVGRKCLVLTGDLSEPAFCDEAVSKTMEAFGRLDILVHNAAWQNRKKVTDIDEAELDFTIKTNLYAYIRLARAAVPHMKPGACILATGSIVGIRGSGEMADYAATKGGIQSVTMSLAEELVDKQIRVNCIAPGPVWTPLNPSDTGLGAKEVSSFGEGTASSPMSRPAQPEEISPAFVFLASQADSSYINGIVLPIYGGPAS